MNAQQDIIVQVAQEHQLNVLQEHTTLLMDKEKLQIVLPVLQVNIVKVQVTQHQMETVMLVISVQKVLHQLRKMNHLLALSLKLDQPVPLYATQELSLTVQVNQVVLIVQPVQYVKDLVMMLKLNAQQEAIVH